MAVHGLTRFLVCMLFGHDFYVLYICFCLLDVLDVKVWILSGLLVTSTSLHLPYPLRCGLFITDVLVFSLAVLR